MTVKDLNNIFEHNNFSDAFGGTEIMIQGLLDNIDNNLLKEFEWIVSYVPDGFKKNPSKITLYYLHDLAEDPSHFKLRDKDFQKNFDFFIFVSNWQKESFRLLYDIPHSKCIVMKNAIYPSEYSENKFENISKVKLIHSSAPHKALPIVLEVYKGIYKLFEDKIELNVFSNFDFYGEKNKIRNKPFEKIYKELKEHSGINYYGSVSHEKVLANMKNNHIFVLPSMFPETSCISLMEAMSSQCVLVTNNLGALSETSANFGMIYNYSEDIVQNARRFHDNLAGAIELLLSNPKQLKEYTDYQKSYADNFYGWQRRAKEWEILLTNINSK